MAEIRQVEADPVQQGQVTDQPDEVDHHVGRSPAHPTENQAEHGQEQHPTSGRAEAHLEVCHGTILSSRDVTPAESPGDSAGTRSPARPLDDGIYHRLLMLRTGLRRFEHWSAEQAASSGLTPAQHQLMLAIRGHPDRRGPTIGEASEYLLLRHHSVVGLVDRAEAAGLVRRTRDGSDHRVIRLQLTDEGMERLEALSRLHREELERLAHEIPDLWRGLPGG
jgi:DNA-binding MarR family transcriptional regulator